MGRTGPAGQGGTAAESSVLPRDELVAPGGKGTDTADGVSPLSSLVALNRDRHRGRSQSPFLPGRAVNGGGSDGVSAAIGVASTDTGSMKSGFARLIVYFSLYLDRRRGPL